MNQKSGERRWDKLATFLMLLLAIAVVGEAMWVWQFYQRDETVEVPEGNILESLGVSIAPPLVHPPISEFNEVTRRPLFESDRRQVVNARAKDAGDPTLAQFASEWRLTGVAIGEERSIAILENRKTGETVSLVTGKRYDGWTIDELTSNKLVIRNGSTVRSFELYKEESRPMSIAEKNGVLVRN